MSTGYLGKCVVLVALACLIGDAQARVKLITLPVRERVEIQLDHPEATLVEEERVVPLLAGLNQVDFSWVNTRIDPTSIVFRVVDGYSGNSPPAKVLSVSYPPNENALVWNVHASQSGSARIRISYLLDDLRKSYSYRAMASHDERHLELKQFLQVRNFANESYENAQIWIGHGRPAQQSVGVRETREILVAHYLDVPIDKTYTVAPSSLGYLNPAQNKLKVAMHYVLTNSRSNKLGQAALAPGKVRIFQRDGHGGNAFTGEDWGASTPLDEEMRLYLGVAQDVVAKRFVEHHERHRIAGKLFNHDVVIRYEFENFKNKPVVLDIAENLYALREELGISSDRDVDWRIDERSTLAEGVDHERTTAGELVAHVSLEPATVAEKAKKLVHRLHIRLQNEW